MAREETLLRRSTVTTGNGSESCTRVIQIIHGSVWLRIISLFTIPNNIQFATTVGEKHTTAAHNVSYIILMKNRTPTTAKRHKDCQRTLTATTPLRQMGIIHCGKISCWFLNSKLQAVFGEGHRPRGQGSKGDFPK
jgi:hypothetical protein